MTEPATSSLSSVNRPDIWLEAQKLVENGSHFHREHYYMYGYSTLLFVGSHFGGKTSIINRFIDPSKQFSTSKYEETIALEYRYAKRVQDDDQSMVNSLSSIGYFPSSNINEKICNIWELGYELLFFDLIQFALTIHTIRNASLIIVLDLTRPNELSVLLEGILKKVRSHLDTKVLKNHPHLRDDLHQLAMKRSIYYRSDQEEDSTVPSTDPMLIPLTIIGSKYDEFQNMDPEIKKQTTRYLRVVSYHQGGQLLYHSSKSDTLTKRVNQALDVLAFERMTFDQENRLAKPSVSTNIAKPVLLPFGYDTLSKIAVTSNHQEQREQFCQIFPQRDLAQSYQSTICLDPRLDSNFSEPEIDKILEYKYMLLDSNN